MLVAARDEQSPETCTRKTHYFTDQKTRCLATNVEDKALTGRVYLVLSGAPGILCRAERTPNEERSNGFHLNVTLNNPIPLYIVETTFRTVVVSDGLPSVELATSLVTDEAPAEFNAKQITDKSQLPPPWTGNCVPYGGDDEHTINHYLKQHGIV
jgi:hypothetical protein